MNQNKFAKAAKFEELNNGRILRNESRPTNAWGGNGNRQPHAQLQLRADGSSKRVVLDDAIVDPVAVGVDDSDNPIYRLIYHDSKLSEAANWTDNQLTEIIDVFSKSNAPEFIEFEVRNGTDYFTINYPTSIIATDFKVRLYREDVYKSISNGDGDMILETIKIFD